jgi:alpha-tubulin suppressor-like RCC1 family protein
LGNGYSRNRAVPTEVPLPLSAANTTWVEVAAGNGHTLAITADGRLFAWGSNDFGQLGDGSTTRSLVPVAVGMTKKLAALRWAHVSTGRFHTLAVTKDGRLYGWGSNRFGQLADNDDAQHNLPVPIAMSPRMAKTVWTQVAAGDAHSLALSADGHLVAWGNNCAGQLGNGGTTWQLNPVPAAAPENAPATTFARIVSGGFHSLAQSADGQLYTWGANLNGQLGDGTTTDRHLPTSQDPSLTSQLESGNGGTASGAHPSGVEPWGLNDNRLMDELPESPSYMMIVRSKDDFRP